MKKQLPMWKDQRPVGDEEWADLADAYLAACRDIGRRPMIKRAKGGS